MIFQNDLYLNKSNWPAEVIIQDSEIILGDPRFARGGSLNLEGYILTNKVLVKDGGIDIKTIPGDSIGVKIGLKVKSDILENPVTNFPDFGAIESE